MVSKVLFASNGFSSSRETLEPTRQYQKATHTINGDLRQASEALIINCHRVESDVLEVNVSG